MKGGEICHDYLALSRQSQRADGCPAQHWLWFGEVAAGDTRNFKNQQSPDAPRLGGSYACQTWRPRQYCFCSNSSGQVSKS